jgi:hypothetical protein
MQRLFDDLRLEGPGQPLDSGTFLFTKGIASGFHYKNLSGGEKAAFDLILDLVIRSDDFRDTVYCIDEPELHIGTGVQRRLLAAMLDILPLVVSFGFPATLLDSFVRHTTCIGIDLPSRLSGYSRCHTRFSVHIISPIGQPAVFQTYTLGGSRRSSRTHRSRTSSLM